MKKYVDIERLKDKYALAFTKGEHIVVTEKIDGANASILTRDDNIIACSRRNELTPDNKLQGFYDFVQTLNAKDIADVLGTNYILFGEWLVKHTIKYPENRMRQFYVFDTFNIETDQYMPWDFTKNVANTLGLNTVPVLYDGPFTSWEDLYALVGKTEMDAEPTGEGIVIKSQDRLDNKFSGTPAYVKIVAKEFSEVHQSKVHNVDPEKIAQKERDIALVETIVTERRVEKIIQKLVEDGVVPTDWDEKNLGTIAKVLPKLCFEDCVKEEPEVVSQVENFGKLCASTSMKHAKNLVK